MKRLVLRRLLLAVPTLFGVTLVTFALMHLAPGDPATAGADAYGAAAVSKQAVELFRHTHGLDAPLPVQYARWLARVATFDFGPSLRDGRPVVDSIAEALPVTLYLAFLALLVAYALAIPIGVYTAARAEKLPARALSGAMLVLYALPSFWVAVTLIVLLGGGRYLDLFPIQGLHSENAASMSAPGRALDLAWHSVLPVACLAYVLAAALARYLRASMLDALSQEYVRAARARGLSEWRVLYRHALRNALAPMAALLGAVVPYLIGGSVVVESIFGLRGLGALSFEALLARDYNAIMAIATLSALATLAAGVAADLLQLALDPRARAEAEVRP